MVHLIHLVPRRRGRRRCGRQRGRQRRRLRDEVEADGKDPFSSPRNLLHEIILVDDARYYLFEICV